jgi:hypothetical protein
MFLSRRGRLFTNCHHQKAGIPLSQQLGTPCVMMLQIPLGYDQCRRLFASWSGNKCKNIR